MSYRALLAVAMIASGGLHPRLAKAADASLPPGAAVRLGDTRFRAGGPVAELLFSPDGTELTSRVPIDEATTRVTVWDAATGTPTRATLEPRRPGTRVRWTATSIPESTRGIVIGTDGVPVVRDFAANKDLARLTGHFARVTAVAVSPDGKRIASASADGFIRVWDAATFRPLAETKGHTAAVRGVELSPDGRLALTTGADGAARVWDLATGRELRAFAIPDDARPTFTADGAAVRIPDGDRVVVRDLVTGLEVVSRTERRSDPFAPIALALRYLGLCAAISPDGRTVAVGGSAGTVELYEIATGQVRRVLAGHAGPCLDLAFTPDGSRLLTAGADHAVLVWPVRVRDVPLTAALRRETDAAKLWAAMTTGNATAAYRAMARLAADPAAAVKMARLRLKPEALTLYPTDARTVELLEAVGTADARAVLRQWADAPADSPRTRAARGALARLGGVRSDPGWVRPVSGTRP